MSKPKLTNSKPGRRSTSKSKASAPDPRFAPLQTNPIFRLPSRKDQKVKLDPRFKHVLSSDAFTRKARVDRYGRPLSSKAGKRELERYYRLDDADPSFQEETNDDEEVKRELQRVEREEQDEGDVYDPARQVGFSQSSSSEEESSDSEDDEGSVVDETNHRQIEGQTIPEGDITRRLAAVNMDWDNLRAADIMAVAQSFCPGEGRVLDVTVLPSEYGRERIEREQVEGPSKELLDSHKHAQQHWSDTPLRHRESKTDVDEGEEAIKRRLQQEQVTGPETLDASSKALRNYQLSRLRYYYAVITTTSASTAHALYIQMDGREYLSTSNFFDLRFVPDDVTFDDLITDKPRDTCAELPANYKPNDFVTDALTHSKVRLTWDEDDRARGEAQKRAFVGAGEDDDLKAYVGSESSGSDDEDVTASTAVEQALQDTKVSKQELARRKTRALLGLSESEPESKRYDDGAPQSDMQITFSSGLGLEKNGSVFANKPEDMKEETTREKYIRRERARKQKRRHKMKTAKSGQEISVQDGKGEDQQELSSENDAEDAHEPGGNEDPFDDPFFLDPSAAHESAGRKKEKPRKQRDAELTAEQREEQEAEREELRRVLDDGELGAQGKEHNGSDHFDMSAIRRAEKRAAKKGRKARKAHEQIAELKQDDFHPDLADDRFKGLYEDTAFAIDPTNPRYSGTKAMKSILEEGRRKRDRNQDDLEGRSANVVADRDVSKSENGDLERLVSKIKKRKIAV